MHMGMVLFVMECRIPPEISLQDVKLFRDLRAFRTKAATMFISIAISTDSLNSMDAWR